MSDDYDITLCSWNVNSVNARIDQLYYFLQKNNIDILLLQEIKCEESKFPFVFFESLGYKSIVLGQKSYNGVSISSKYPFKISNNSLLYGDGNSRYLEVIVSVLGDYLTVCNVYAPNGRSLESDQFEYKLKFLDSLICRKKLLMSQGKNIIFAGDYNVALDVLDVYDANQMSNSLCFSVKERSKMRSIIYDLDYIDVLRCFKPEIKCFTWWDYRSNSYSRDIGMRIDYIFCTPWIFDCVKRCSEIKDLRSFIKPSDHCPVLMNLNMKQS